MIARTGIMASGKTQPTPIPSVTIGTQIWSLYNLDVVTYLNGDPIPQVTDPTQWASLTTGAWCWFNNDSANGPIYGRLYNWYAVNDPRGLAPQGWHVPSQSEWLILVNYLGGYSVAGGEMKETGTSHWINPNAGATNSSGFTGLPGGYRTYNGLFYEVGEYGFFWTSTPVGLTAAYQYSLDYSYSGISNFPNNIRFGFSVRLIKN